MASSYTSGSEARRQQVRVSHQPLNGIDYVELLPFAESAPGDTGAYLLVYMLKSNGVASFRPDLVSIRGGSRLTTIDVQWTVHADALLTGSAIPPYWAWDDNGQPRDHVADLAAYFEARGQYDPNNPGDLMVPSRVLVVRTWTRGDLAEYTLSLTSPSDVVLDRQLQSARFAFQVDESEFDRGTTPSQARAVSDEPEIDYLSKDYGSFRRLMLDRMSTLLPDWTERNPADLGVTLVEVMSAAADYLSYYQDAVATEAYLGTARQRISVRRHARLLDFLMHDGCNARTFVALEVGSELALPPTPDSVVQFLTAVDTLPPAARADQLDDPSVLTRAEVFEPLHDVVLRSERNVIPFYTWGATRAVLPKGATQATLRNADGNLPNGGIKLAAGDLLLLEEIRHPSTADEGDARPDRRQVVRLTSVIYTSDPLYDEDTGELYQDAVLNPNPLQVADVGWSDADALAFDLEIGTLPGPDGAAAPLQISVARGNVVLVDHGRTVHPDELLEVDDVERAPPRLKEAPLTQQGRVRDHRGMLVPMDLEASASHALEWELRDVQPSVLLRELGENGSGDASSTQELWYPRRDLLGSDRFASEFVVEVDDDERAWLRFGDDYKGRRPLAGTRFVARYRVGNGSRGNISAEALRHVVFTSPSAVIDDYTNATTGILRVRNPLPGVGGREPQSKDEVRLLAPTAFRTQERAVTEADYAAIAARHPEVQKASAVFRWTGSWHTVFIFVERVDGAPVDDAFRARLGAFLERYRMSRHDVRIESPRYVPLDIAFVVHVSHDYLASNVRKALLEAFSNVLLPNGTRGFFHPQNWTFGQPVLLSQVVALAMAVPGVDWINFTDPEGGITRFRRWGAPAQKELEEGVISIGPLEIARLDDDAGRPENGRLEFFMEGGP
ncbi:MAG TPA: putative baseplate assembly protein [Polyangium sp.]|nr:putative baseplate assembly protein [Polyangium sp.]